MEVKHLKPTNRDDVILFGTVSSSNACNWCCQRRHKFKPPPKIPALESSNSAKQRFGRHLFEKTKILFHQVHKKALLQIPASRFRPSYLRCLWNPPFLWRPLCLYYSLLCIIHLSICFPFISGN